MKKLLITGVALSLAAVIIAQPSLQKGIQLLENENYQGALEQFNALAKSDPKNGTIYYYIGQVSYLKDDVAGAESAYKQGLSINSNCAECKVGLGQLKLDAGKADEASDLFDSAKRLDKKNPDIYAKVGEAYLYAKKPNAEKAVNNLLEARDMDTKVARYWAELGDAYKLKGDNGEAMTNYEYAVEKDPKYASAYTSMAKIWMGAKNYDAATENLEKAIDLNPENAIAYKNLIEIKVAQKKWNEVTPLLEKYTSLIGDDVDAKVRYVKFLTFQAKDYERAISVGEELLKSHPEQYTLHRWLAWSYFEKSMYKESYLQSEKLFEDIKKDQTRQSYPSDYKYWGDAAFELKEFDDAAHIYRKYIELVPEEAAEIYAKLAKAYYDAKNYEQAIAYYKRKGEVKKLSVGEEWYLGLSYYLSKQDTQADSCFANVLSVSPEYAQAWYYRAVIARNASDADSTLDQYAALPYYEKYVELTKPDSDYTKKNLQTALTYIAVYYAQKEEYDSSYMTFQKVVEIDSTSDWGKQAMGNIKLIKSQK